MKRLICCLAFLLVTIPVRSDVDDETTARRAAFEMAGASSNDGFKIRDGFWAGKIPAKESRLIQVNLYAGNQYWFVAAAGSPARKISVTVFDESGLPVKSESAGDSRAIAAFSPDASGPYFIRIEEAGGEPATFCLIYSYK